VPKPERVLWIACGALAKELTLIRDQSGLHHVEIACLPASLHNTPDRIADRVQARIEEAGDRYDRIFVAYADCGTGGRLDAVLDAYGAERLAGAHCYEVFAGAGVFRDLHEEEPGTFYLTDFLVHHFDRLVIQGLGIDHHPELLPLYFGNYHRVVYLAQRDDARLREEARSCAKQLDLAFEHRFTGLATMESALRARTTERSSWPS
jgi:hypothetical protein